jgi:Protein of unknown function (DUF4012)
VERSPSRRGKTIGPGIALTAAIAATAAVFAALAPGTPTGIGWVDTTLKVLLAVACVTAGRLTPWPFVALAAVIATAASYGSPAAFPSVLVLGTGLAYWRVGSPAGAPIPGIVRAAACGALGDIALRAGWPQVTFAPSAAAAIVTLAILLPAAVLAPKRARRILARATVLVILVGLAMVALAMAGILEAHPPLSKALSAAHNAIRDIEHGDESGAVADFERSAEAFETARHDLMWAGGAEVVPVVSQQVRALRTAANIGTSLAKAGLATASTANVENLKLVDGAFPVRRLEALQPVFRRDVRVLSDVMTETSVFSSPWIISPLRAKLAALESRLRQASHDARLGLEGSEQVPAILGADGPQTYLILVENNAEARAAGGVVGDYAEVTADRGRLSLTKVGSVGQLDHDGVPPRQRTLPPIPDFADRYGSYYPQEHWENITMSPDFPTVGAVAAYLFPQSGGVKVNDVLGIDPVALQGLLKMIGPITAKGPGHRKIELTQWNIRPFLASKEFVEFKVDTLRIRFVGNLLRQVWRDLATRALPALPQLVKDMEGAVHGGDLRIYSSAPSEEAFYEMIHVAGQMPPFEGDFLGVVTQNNAGNKIDWYLRRSIAYDATLDVATRSISSTVTVKLTNLAPASGLPPIVIDGVAGAGTRPGENLDWLNIYTPWHLESATLDGRPLAMMSQYELGRSVYSAVIAIQAGQTVDVQLHLAGTWPAGLDRYHLGWYHQPMLWPDQVSRPKVTIIG